jgi:Flp pilus assembly protein TadG
MRRRANVPEHYPQASRSWAASPAHRRRGAALVEGTLVLGVFLVIIFATCDLGLAVLRQNSLAAAARRLARAAIVHGDNAGPQLSEWGPAAYVQTAAHASEPAAAVRPVLVTLNPANVSINVTWPDGGNKTGQRVTAVVTYQHAPILPFLFGSGPLQLRGESTMCIEH